MRIRYNNREMPKPGGQASVLIHSTLQTALKHHHAGQFEQAEVLYKQILTRQPNHAEAMHYLGVIAIQRGQHPVAVDLIRRSLVLNASNAKAWFNLGTSLMESGILDQAIIAFRNATSIEPIFPDAFCNLGNLLKITGQVNEAVIAYRRAIALKPNYHEVHCNLGFSLRELGKIDEAISAYRQAIAIKPDFSGAYNNLGIALKDKGQLYEAIAAFRKAIALKADFPEAHNNLGNALKDGGQLEEAAVAYRQAIAMRPGYSEAHSNLIFCLQYHPSCGAAEIAQECFDWNRLHAEPLKQFIQPHLNERNPQRRLRIGYVSSDFRNHPVGRFVLPLLAHHDKTQVEVFVYSQAAGADTMTERLRAFTDCWRGIVGLTDAQAADLIRKDGIDVLVDLSLHTGGNRLLVFARKPAPVQVSWMGYPGSTGLETIDYRLSDPHLDPLGMDESIYSEHTIRLPDTFWCYDPVDGREIYVNPLPALANGFVTFGCLGNFCKFGDSMFALWARVIREAKNSRLLLLASSYEVQMQRAMELLRHEGVDISRVEFVPRLSHCEYLRHYHRIDVALDSLPYNGHTTSMDGLWMGVPVVSLVGKTAVGRAGLSILSNLSLSELVANSEEQFVNIAVELAENIPRLGNLRSTIRKRMEESPLMDAVRFARNIEVAYRQMWRAWCESSL
jgi:protein O-GlcNAc transferase